MSDLLSVEDVAAEVNRSPATIRYWIKEGAELGPAFGKYGRRRMAHRADVAKWIESKRPSIA